MLGLHQRVETVTAPIADNSKIPGKHTDQKILSTRQPGTPRQLSPQERPCSCELIAHVVAFIGHKLIVDD